MKIVVLDGYTLNPGDLTWEALEAIGECQVYDRTSLTDEAEIVARISDADVGIIINNSRGPLIVEQDLREALDSGKVYAAGLDVVSTEPIKGDNPLLGAKNCIITPHISWAPLESRARLMNIAVENLRAFVAGQVSFEPCWPASKVLWVARHEPEIFAQTKKILLIEDYFIYRLTGRYATEGSLVCSSTYWDIINRRYWQEMLDYLHIDESMLPPVVESGTVVGKILPEVARDLGLTENLTVATSALDQAAGAIGAGVVAEGMFSENIGAALAICAPVNRPVFDPNGKMPLFDFPVPGMYMIHTFTNGGMTLRWFRDKFCELELAAERAGLGDAYESISREVESVPAGSDGLIMLPHLAGSMAPDANAKAKGVYFGFTLAYTRQHFMRALMESLGYILRRNLDALREMGISVREVRSLGGGSKSAIWNQIKADINDVTLETVHSSEAASLGAAILAGRAVGIFPDVAAAARAMVRVKKRTMPNAANAAVYNAGYALYKKLFNDLNGCFALTK